MILEKYARPLSTSTFEQFYDKLEEGKVYYVSYYVSKGRINLAKKKFTNVQNEYEMAFQRETEVVEACFFPLQLLSEPS